MSEDKFERIPTDMIEDRDTGKLLSETITELDKRLPSDDVISTKADFAYVDNALAAKADISYVVDELLGKADKSVYGLVSEKADQTYVDQQIANVVAGGTIDLSSKADKTYVDGELAKKVVKGELFINVKDYGAKGDGLADDTKAFNDAIAIIKSAGGGTLFIPKTNAYYWVRGEVELCSNLTISSNFATLDKRNYTNSNLFTSRSYTRTGYGSGVNNVIIHGLEFMGNFDTNHGVTNTFHHAQNIKVLNCIFRECQISGHQFDLGGCNDILIDGCTWYGFDCQATREYTECIQIDHSSYLSQPSMANTDTFDGIPTKNVTVQNCKFLPYTKNGVTYPAPNPMGNHSRLEGTIYKNLKFINNHVVDGRTTSDNSSHANGWVHFYHADGVIIEGNRFELTSSTPDSCLPIFIMAYNTVHLLADISKTDSAVVNYTPIPCKNVKIINNTFVNFSNKTVGNAIVQVEGSLSAIDGQPYYAENIVMEGNSFLNCYNPANITDTQGFSDDNIYFQMVKNGRIKNNYFNTVRRMVYTIDSINVDIIGNHAANVYWHPVNANNVTGLTIEDNIINNTSGAFYIQNSISVYVNNNKISGDFGTSFSANLIAIRSCTLARVKNNTLIGTIGSKFNSIAVYTGSDNVVVENNYISGFLPILVTGSTNVKYDAKTGLTIVTVGDSITNGGDTYGYYQDSMIPLIPNVQNHYKRGYSGYCYAKSSTNAYSSILDVSSQFEVADVYTVLLGTNDFSRDVPIGSYTEPQGTLNSLWGGMKQLYVDLRAKNPTAIIVIITPMKRTKSPAWNIANGIGLKMDDYVAAIKAFAAQYALPLIDLYNISGVNTATDVVYLYDGLHPNKVLNERIGRIIGKNVNLFV